jgi:hypothetical protein|tara:strand:- start:8369 stop:8623 length:255 start_codon:yes stop_codon:yes gene_type:complete
MDNNKKVPRIIRNLDTSQRRTHFNEKILLCSAEKAAERLAICKQCTAFKDWGCVINGNFMPRTTRLRASGCPYGKWLSAFKETK